MHKILLWILPSYVLPLINNASFTYISKHYVDMRSRSKLSAKLDPCYFRKPIFLHSLAQFFPNPELRGFKSHNHF